VVKEAGVALIRRIIYRISVPLLPHTWEDGFQLAMFVAGDEEQFFAATREALKLIRNNDPRRYARLKNDLRRIALVRAGGEFYDAGIRTYMMNSACLESRTPPELAAAIVHEGAHARLHSCGVRCRDRDRVESFCVRQEVAFAKTLPNSSVLISSIRERMRDPWWSESQLADRYERYLRGLGAPRWLARLGRKFSSFD
jgi:hypothetical protein